MATDRSSSALLARPPALLRTASWTDSRLFAKRLERTLGHTLNALHTTRHPKERAIMSDAITLVDLMYLKETDVAADVDSST